MIRKIAPPPFVECPDDYRCGQTVIMMILKHFYPDRDWTWDDADRICHFKPGYHTWSSAVIPGMLSHGFEAIYIYDFDRQKFLSNPEKYALEKYGEATVQYIHRNGGFSVAVEIENSLQNDLPSYRPLQRDWQWQDVELLLKEGFLLFTWVNARKLYNHHDSATRVSGHFVLLHHYNPDNRSVLYHDGGSNFNGAQHGANKNAYIGADHFMHAAKSTHGDGGMLIIALRPKSDETSA